MSTLRNPVGPKDPKVYMRRRLAVLAGLIAVIAVIVLLFVRPGSSGGPNEPATADATAAAESAQSGTKTKKGAAGETAPCAVGQMKVTAITDKASYAASELPQLSLSAENTGEKACSADLGTAGMAFTITSGEDEVWRSTDCQTNPASLAVVLEPGKPLTSETIEWDRTRSSTETCDVAREPVGAEGASYHLRVSAGGVQSASSAQFLLY